MFTHSCSERFLFNDNSICGSSNMDDRRLIHATVVVVVIMVVDIWTEHIPGHEKNPSGSQIGKCTTIHCFGELYLSKICRGKKKKKCLPKDSLKECFLHSSSNMDNRRMDRASARSRQEPNWQQSSQICHRRHSALHLVRPF